MPNRSVVTPPARLPEQGPATWSVLRALILTSTLAALLAGCALSGGLRGVAVVA